MNDDKLFSRELGEGDSGPDVTVLQVVLKVLGCNPSIKINGNWEGEEMNLGIDSLQCKLGVEPITRKLDSATKVALFKRTGLDLDSLPKDLFVDNTSNTKEGRKIRTEEITEMYN